MNRRGLNPTFLRHELKPEDSNEESTEEEEDEFGSSFDILEGDEANPEADTSTIEEKDT